MPVTVNTIALLNQFRRDQSADAFATLTRRYVNLVFSVAHRRLNDPALAEAATQTVFARLAGVPPLVTTESELLGWFHQTAIDVTLNLRPSDSCRKDLEQIVATPNPGMADRDPLWTEIALYLDAAIENLTPTERQAVLMKFFEDKSHHDIGSKFGLGAGDNISKIHVGRALERLRISFSSKGIVCTLGTLATLLDDYAIETAPGSLVTRLSRLPDLSGSTPPGAADPTPSGWLPKIAALFRKGVGP